MSRRRGFTLIELLVVIAIIGILAAMLFPVFARARESARKTQCLANVKNIALAMNMYLTDYDALWPKEQNQTPINLYIDLGCNQTDSQTNATIANPYLREAVILDDYIKNRDVWRCPSAKIEKTTFLIVSSLPGRPWWQAYVDTDKVTGQICATSAFPPGWGGDVTDSLVQGTFPTQNAFVQNILANANLADLKTSSIGDAARFVATGESTVSPRLATGNQLAYGDTCGWSLHHDWASPCASRPDPTCGWTTECQLDGDDAYLKFWNDSAFRKPYARHMGGVNLGFLDGHAKWWSSEAILAASPGAHGPDADHMVPNPQPELEGNLCVCAP